MHVFKTGRLPEISETPRKIGRVGASEKLNYNKTKKRNPLASILLRPLNGLLLRPLKGFFRDGLLLEIIFANSRSGLLFEMNTAYIEIEDCSTLSRTSTQILQPRNILECQIILKKNTNLTIYCQ